PEHRPRPCGSPAPLRNTTRRRGSFPSQRSAGVSRSKLPRSCTSIRVGRRWKPRTRALDWLPGHGPILGIFRSQDGPFAPDRPWPPSGVGEVMPYYWPPDWVAPPPLTLTLTMAVVQQQTKPFPPLPE